VGLAANLAVNSTAAQLPSANSKLAGIRPLVPSWENVDILSLRFWISMQPLTQ
jgi:hypothetical protein